MCVCVCVGGGGGEVVTNKEINLYNDMGMTSITR